MTVDEFYKKEDPANNIKYSETRIEEWLFDENDMKMFAEAYHQEKMKEECKDETDKLLTPRAD